MSHVIEVKDVVTIQTLEGYSMSVIVDVYDDEELIGERRFGFPLETKTDVIKEELAKLAATLDSDKEVGIASAELEAGLANVADVKEELMSEEDSPK